MESAIFIKKIFQEELKKCQLLDNEIEMDFKSSNIIEDSILIILKLFDVDGKQIAENNKLKILLYKSNSGRYLAFWETIKLKEEFKTAEMMEEINSYMIRILNRFNKRKK
jgi:hypothetical protein